ncbi:MAG: S8 family serine peptidase [Thermodesulfobacteriota bacterium]
MATITFTDKLPTIETITRMLIQEALKRTGGDKSAAARMLGLSEKTLGKQLKKWRSMVGQAMLVLCLLFTSPGARADEAGGFVDGQVVVRFQADAHPADIAALIQDHGLTVHEQIDAIQYYVLILPPGADVTAMVAELKKNPLVNTCEPNYDNETLDFPNDELFPRQWSLDNPETGGFGMAVTKAWEVEAGSSDIIVAVIDMGFDLTHEDLQANLWRNPGEIENNGVDDDRNGYVDDITGWDFVNQPVGLEEPANDYRDEDNDPTFRLSSHGNRVQGIIGATTGNGIGIAGIAGKSRVMLIRAGYMNTEGNAVLSSSHVAKGVIYAADNGARVINISSGSDRYSNSYKAALEYAASKGVLIVCSAGNEGSGSLVYPAAYDIPGLISVGATDKNDGKSWFSNFGDWVDVSAPGQNIVTTLLDNGYGETQGTSFSAPMVAATAALIFARYPLWTPAQVKDQIMNTVDVAAGLSGANLTSGRVNAYRALTADPASFGEGTETTRTQASTAQAPAAEEGGSGGGGCFIASTSTEVSATGMLPMGLILLIAATIRPLRKKA